MKYVLIDFWFSHCVPCIVQFPKLRELYEQYRYKGFQIIGISIDAKKDKGEWLKAIAKYKLSWDHFLDTDHFEASRLSVSTYPTTFLLGSDGKIISRNLELSELEEFLKKEYTIIGNIYINFIRKVLIKQQTKAGVYNPCQWMEPLITPLPAR